MLPTHLEIGQFSGYPPEARRLVAAHLDALRQLPLSFLPSLLRELIDYDYRFPAERASLDSEMLYLSSLTAAELAGCFEGFAHLHVSEGLEHLDWIAQPGQFVEQLSAYLWSTHQLDAFREAATEYGARLAKVTASTPLPLPRLGIAVIGQGVASYNAPLFRKLREHGTYFSNVKPENGVPLLVAAVAARAEAHPAPYGHWYVDGGEQVDHSSLLTSISYQALAPTREALLKNIQGEIAKPGMGPEALRTHLALLAPGALGLHGDAVLDRFQVKLFTEGSGTQIFSTTFAQWATREILRRAQALTLLVRFAPRQRQRPMNELLSSDQAQPELDALGSLIDADMAAYYHWINQQRLTGSERSGFIVWFEGHPRALAIGPSLPRGAESGSPVDLAKLVSLAAT